MTLAGTIRKRESHLWEREQHDHYVEEQWCSVRLFEEEKFSGTLWDPCCGFGRIPEAAKAAGKFKEIYASDIIDRGYFTAGFRDLLSQDFLQTFNDVGIITNIICNPPFGLIPAFATQALKLATQKVVLLFPVARLNAAHWIQGKPLKTIWLLTPRPSMPPGYVIARGEKPGGGKIDFCWLVFEQGYKGEPVLRWLRRDK